MVTLFLQIGNSDTVDAELGYSLLGVNVGVTQVTQSIVIQPERPFLYYNARLSNALDSGVISQEVYDLIISEQDESRNVAEINDNLDIDKQLLVDLVVNNNIENVETGGTSAQIVEDVINEGYVFVNKI